MSMTAFYSATAFYQQDVSFIQNQTPDIPDII